MKRTPKYTALLLAVLLLATALFPSIPVLRSDWQFYGMSDSWNNTGNMDAFSDEWVRRNIQSVGPLGVAYPNKVFGYETDSPALLYMFKNGLNDPDEWHWGGWGGRFTQEKVLNPPVCDWAGIIDESAYKPFYGYRDEPDTWYYEEGDTTFVNDLAAPIARWRTAFQNEMATRMQWSVTDDYSAANHTPTAVLNGDETLNILTVGGVAGQSVALSAAGSSDPDGDALQYKWYVYAEPGTYRGEVAIDGADSAQSTVHIPADAVNDSIHVVLEVTDNGTGFPLTAYRRAVLTTGAGGKVAGDVYTVNDDVVGTGANQFQYEGAWNHYTGQFRNHQNDNHCSNVAGDVATLRFYGRQVKLYGMINRAHGIAAVSVDGGPETMVDFYAHGLTGAITEGDVLLYTSAELPEGEHTLTVRVTGEKNPAATNCHMVIDRADVLSTEAPPEGPNPPAIEPGSVYALEPKCAPGLALDVYESGRENGSNVNIWAYTGTPSNHWKIVDAGGGYYALEPQVAPGKALDVFQRSSEDGANVNIWDYDGSSSNLWKIVDAGDGCFTLEPQCAPGKCLNVAGGAAENGTNVDICTADGVDSNLWRLTKVA